MQGQTNKQILTGQRPRALRNNASDAERALWIGLKNLELERCKFGRQHPFGDNILDFVCLERRVVIKRDGSQHFDASEDDRVRTGFLRSPGFVMLRRWNSAVFSNIGGELEVSHRELIGRARTPSPPDPRLEGES